MFQINTELQWQYKISRNTYICKYCVPFYLKKKIQIQIQMAELNSNDSNESITLIFNALKTSCYNNAAYFSTDDTEGGKRLNAAFQNIVQHANAIEPQVKEINSIAKSYDYDEKCKGNGFRSFVSVVSSSIKYTIQVSHKVCVKRDNLWFRKNNVIR